ncbi:hypothetical protein LEMLEM_LOCUS20047 [Lemmus lemmus]
MSLFWTPCLTVTFLPNNLEVKGTPHDVCLEPDGPSDSPDPEAAPSRAQSQARSLREIEYIFPAAGLVKDTAGIFTSASPTIAPDVDPSSSMTMKPNAFVLLFALALLLLLKYLQ